MDSNLMQIISVHTVKPELIDFPIPELLQLMAMHSNIPRFQEVFAQEDQCGNLEYAYQLRNQNIKYLPFIRLNFPKYKYYPAPIEKNDPLYVALNEIVDRAVLTQSFVLLLAQGENYQDLKNNVNEELLIQYTQDPEQSINFQVFCGNRQTTKQEQLEAIEFITEAFDIKGTIDIKSATRNYWICEYHQPFETFNKPLYKETLKRVFFGVQIAFNRKNRRHYTSDYELPNRAYLGPTSTSAPLAFLMSNMAQVKRDHVVLDPFVGTGGLLVPAAHFGAVTFGSDIDARVIHGHAVGHLNTNSNYQFPEKPVKPYMFYSFLQYGFPVPELIRQDCLNSGFQREFFDAIICDPPYGIRAISRGTGKKHKKYPKPQEENKETPQKQHIIPTKKVDHLLIYEQLFNAAEKMLKQGGMLIYLYPFDRGQGPTTLKDIPTHEKFELVNFSEEVLTMAKSRILITMRKN